MRSRFDPTPREPGRVIYEAGSQIVAERFARGEITEAEFEQAKMALGPDR
jgi:uncharacterized membrane protein